MDRWMFAARKLFRNGDGAAAVVVVVRDVDAVDARDVVDAAVAVAAAIADLMRMMVAT